MHVSAMNLSDWLLTRKKTATWLAEQVGVDRSVISRIKDGRVTPSLETAVAIHKATNGDVKPEDLIRRDDRVAS